MGDPLVERRWGRLWFLLCVLSCVPGGAGCDLAKVDVRVEQLCLASEGPTVPGLSALLPADAGPCAPTPSPACHDGGLPWPFDASAPPGFPLLDAGARERAIAWTAVLEFNAALEQLPSSAAGLDVVVSLSAVRLASTTDLGFVDAIQATLASGPCAAADAGRVVAAYRRSGDAEVGRTLNLAVAEPELNLYDCLKSAPVNLDVSIEIDPRRLGADDAPLALTTCVSARSSAGFP